MSEFFAMGGYAFYVWGSFGATALVVATEVLSVRSRRLRALEEARLATPDNLAAATRGVL
jgi:heme exporter protein D